MVIRWGTRKGGAPYCGHNFPSFLAAGDYTGRIGPASFYDRRKSGLPQATGADETDQSGTVTCRAVDVIGSGDRGGLGRRFTRGPLGRQGTGDLITGRRAIRISQGP